MEVARATSLRGSPLQPRRLLQEARQDRREGFGHAQIKNVPIMSAVFSFSSLSQQILKFIAVTNTIEFQLALTAESAKAD